jgi:hypothetical protein
MSTKAFLSVFNAIAHTGFDSEAFRSIFIKAAWKSYTDNEVQPISQSRFQTIIVPLYNALFLDDHKEINKAVGEIRELLVEQEKIEKFLSDTFYIVLNYYIKSFYGLNGGWKKIAPFASAIERFIAYVTQRVENESFFLFEDALINSLEMLRQNSQSIMVLNTYYGVPIEYPAKIPHTDTNSVVLNVHPLQETAALLQNGIYILQNDHFENDIYASVNPVTIDGKRFLELSRFDELETSLFHRQSIRVHPHQPYQFTIIHPSLTLKTQAYDISIVGIAVTSKQFYSLSPFVDVVLIFPSEIMGQKSEIKGQLVFKSAYEGGYKYHFKITPTVPQEADLSKYIARREQEIIKKLREELI